MMNQLSLLFLLMLSLGTLGKAQAKYQADAPLRVGVAGLTHGHVHWILRRAADPDIELVGIAEPNRALAERLMKQYKLPAELWYAKLPDMLDATKPEAVTAFNDIYGHLAVVEACAPRGIHVMVEKPLAVNLNHATTMAKLARTHGIHLLTNYETTWYPSHHKLYEVVHEAKGLGDLRKFVVHDGHQGPIEIGCSEEFLAWLTDPTLNGAGALTDFGCYGANLITWLMKGERPRSVFAVTQQIKPDRYPKVDDEATIILTYPQAQGIIQASWNWPYSRKDMEVYGTQGAAFADDRSNLRMRVETKEENHVLLPPLAAPLDDPFSYFRAVVRGQIDPDPFDLSSLDNNLLVVEILSAARKSARSGRQVNLK